MAVPSFLRPHVASLVAHDVDLGAPGVLDRAVAAGTTVLQPVTPRTTAAPAAAWPDPVGNRWSFGDHQPC